MTIIFALVGMTGLAWSAVALFLAIFPGKRRKRLIQSAVAFSVFISSIIATGVTAPRSDELAQKARPEPEASGKIPPSPPTQMDNSQAVSTPETIEPRHDPVRLKQEREAAEYIERIRAERAIISAFGAREFVRDAQTILIAVETLNAFAKSYEAGSQLTLSPEQQDERRAFRRALSQKQQQSLPILRDAYGPAMRRALWEADGEARTIGSGYRTVEFVNVAFAANRNIKKIHEDMYPTLMKLRFTRAQYKWFSGASEYQYYTLTPPQDHDLVTWRPNGSFSVIE